MVVEFKKVYEVDYSKLNQDLELRLKDAFDFSQNTSTEYFKSYKSDNIYIKDNLMLFG